MDHPKHVSPPQFLFVQVNKRCNLRCQHCDFWMLDDDDRPNYLSWDLKKGILASFAEMAPGAAVVICGGESMLDLDDYFAISRECRALGLRSLSVVNGTRIRDQAMAQRMMTEGPDEVSVSLNSYRAALHDETRGVPGAFDKAVRAVRLLLDARRALSAMERRVYVMGLIFSKNYREIEHFYEFVLHQLGADKLKLNFLQPSFGHNDAIDPFFRDNCQVDPQELGQILDRCNARFGLRLSPVWMSQVQMYFRSLAQSSKLEQGWKDATGTADHICNTYERNIMIDHYGVARLCFSNGFPGVKLEKPSDLKSFWYSAEPIRRKMQSCKAYCGISHSVRRQSATMVPTQVTRAEWPDIQSPQSAFAHIL